MALAIHIPVAVPWVTAGLLDSVYISIYQENERSDPAIREGMPTEPTATSTSVSKGRLSFTRHVMEGLARGPWRGCEHV